MAEEKVYLYTVYPKRQITGLSGVNALRVPKSVFLTKEDVKICLPRGSVYRRFANTGENVRVTPNNLDRLHNAEFISEEDWEKGTVTTTEEAPVVEEVVEEPVAAPVEEEVVEEVPEEDPIVEEVPEEPVAAPVEEEVIEEVPEEVEVVEEDSLSVEEVEEEEDEEDDVEEVVVDEEGNAPVHNNNNNHYNHKKKKRH